MTLVIKNFCKIYAWRYIYELKVFKMFFLKKSNMCTLKMKTAGLGSSLRCIVSDSKHKLHLNIRVN